MSTIVPCRLRVSLPWTCIDISTKTLLKNMSTRADSLAEVHSYMDLDLKLTPLANDDANVPSRRRLRKQTESGPLVSSLDEEIKLQIYTDV